MYLYDTQRQVLDLKHWNTTDPGRKLKFNFLSGSKHFMLCNYAAIAAKHMLLRAFIVESSVKNKETSALVLYIFW